LKVSPDTKLESSAPPTAFEKAGQETPPSLIAELRYFIFENKKWWLIPILLAMSLVGLLVVLGSTGAAPFIYTLF
jgi:Family of unknown function (DUF5989)